MGEVNSCDGGLSSIHCYGYRYGVCIQLGHTIHSKHATEYGVYGLIYTIQHNEGCV